jgi:hypothetical protein
VIILLRKGRPINTWGLLKQAFFNTTLTLMVKKNDLFYPGKFHQKSKIHLLVLLSIKVFDLKTI